MRCTSCATPIPAGVGFCVNCGDDVPASPAGLLDPAESTDSAALTRLLREATAGEYEIEREIGRGGMGAVYLATEIHLRRRVAIKVLPPSRTGGDAGVERFRREARTAAALDHPGIIPIHRVGSSGSLMWYSMKLLEGRSLERLLEESGRLELDETIAILDQVADALDYAHERGVVHRDIKPGNIVLDERGRAIVTDFGIAKEVHDRSLSISGPLVGTPQYMAPEQYLGAEITPAADQYALAVVAYECLCGRLPFGAATLPELREQHVSAHAPLLGGARPGLPLAAQSAVERAMRKNPAERFTSVSEFVDALAGRTPVAASAHLARRRAVLAGWAAGILITIIVLGGALLSAGQNGDSSGTLSGLADERAPVPPPVVPAPDSGRGEATAIDPPPAVSKSMPARVEAPTAVLIIRMVDGWARIYVNGERRRERPVHREVLPPGTHTLRFERPGYIPIDTTLTLRPGERVLEIRMQRLPS